MADSFLLREAGDYLLLESGDRIILEATSAIPVVYCLEKSASFVPGLEAFADDRHSSDLVSVVTGGSTVKRC